MVPRLLIDPMIMVQDAYAVVIGSAAPNRTTRRLKWKVLDQRREFPHLPRKLYHMANGLVCFILYAFWLTDGQALWVLGVIGGSWFAFDVLRLKSAKVREAALVVFGRLMRREELRSLTGNSFFILGLFIVTAVFPRPIVALSVLYLALGDPIAAIVGTAYGKTKICGKKSLEGAIANFFVSAGATALVAATILDSPSVVLLSVFGGLASAIAEILPIKVDDNLTIPVVSASLLWLASLVVPLF